MAKERVPTQEPIYRKDSEQMSQRWSYFFEYITSKLFNFDSYITTTNQKITSVDGRVTTIEGGAVFKDEYTFVKETPGYRISHDGFIEQWGTITLPSSITTRSSAVWTYPIPFPNAVLHITPIPQDYGNLIAPLAATFMVTPMDTISATIVGCTNNGSYVFSNSIQVMCRAIGY